jgi:hypothetical protein
MKDRETELTRRDSIKFAGAAAATLKRTPKVSANWFREAARRNTVV